MDPVNLAVLRLAAELRLQKCSQQYQQDQDKVLAECHQAKQAYKERLAKYVDLLTRANEAEKTAQFQAQLEDSLRKLDENKVNVQVVQKLVHQLEGRSENYHINVDQLKNRGLLDHINRDAIPVLQNQDEVNNEGMVKEIATLQEQSLDLRVRVDRIQNDIIQCSDLALRTTANLVHDVISE